MRRHFIVFSSLLFLFIFISGSIAFIILMEQVRYRDAMDRLARTVELERHKLEAEVNSDIAIVLKMATSPVILQYFLNPYDPVASAIALKDIEGYRRMFASASLFWVKDKNKKFFLDGREAYTVDPDDPELYWYNMTMHNTEHYNFNIDYDPHLKVTNIWINAPVFDADGKPLGILGTGINLSQFIDAIYKDYTGNADLYFFNAFGEITGARNIDLVVNKVGVDRHFGRIGHEILDAAKKIAPGETNFFEIPDRNGIAALASIPALEWHVLAIHRFSIADILGTGMTALFAVMMAVILAVFAVFNIFLAKLLGPLYHMVKEIGQISTNWNLKPKNEAVNDSVEAVTLGEFLNMTIMDELTGIYNRRYFDGNIKQIIKSLSGAHGKMSILMVDIDYFKNYNEAYGEVMGDNCLRGIAAALSQCLDRDDDFVARYGGEEFVVVLTNSDEDGARRMAEKLLKRVRDCCIPHERSDAAAIVTISIGGTTAAVKHSHNGSDYVKRTEAALHRSKYYGRNQYSFENF